MRSVRFSLSLAVVSVAFSIMIGTADAAPPQTEVANGNWAGYVVSGQASAITPTTAPTVWGQWTVPKVHCAFLGETSRSAVWIGLGGVDGAPLAQVATVQACRLGIETYALEYQVLPDFPDAKVIGLVAPGDVISAYIYYLGTTDAGQSRYDITVSDATSGLGLGTTEYVADQSNQPKAWDTAEWIVEAPTYNKTVSSLAQFDPVTFVNCGSALGYSIPGDYGTGLFREHLTKPAGDNSHKAEPSELVNDLANSPNSFTVSWSP